MTVAMGAVASKRKKPRAADAYSKEHLPLSFFPKGFSHQKEVSAVGQKRMGKAQFHQVFCSQGQIFVLMPCEIKIAA